MLRVAPNGKLGRRHADFRYSPRDFRFTVGKDGALYAFCMTVPAAGTELKITTLDTDAGLLAAPIRSVKLLGGRGELTWRARERHHDVTTSRRPRMPGLSRQPRDERS
ncbi:MAG TPA: hypothetical protein VKA54_18250 [Gemmatimonadaceae bacterium]|nr:hypothetical protein [Gemmatimonadaceae bacterium]